MVGETGGRSLTAGIGVVDLTRQASLPYLRMWSGIVAHVVTGPLGISPGENSDLMTASITASFKAVFVLSTMSAQRGFPD